MADTSSILFPSRQKSSLYRFISKIRIDETGCWLWVGSLTNEGYGNIRFGKRNNLAHRISYELMVAPIPSGLQIDHICCNRRCVNPAHLEPVTQRENIVRGVAARKLRTHCKRGHPLTPDNISGWVTSDRRFARTCLTCVRARQRVYRRPTKTK